MAEAKTPVAAEIAVKKLKMASDAEVTKIAVASEKAISKLEVSSDAAAAKIIKVAEEVSCNLRNIAATTNEAATKLLATQAEAAVRVVNAKGSDDHDSIVRVLTLLEVVQKDITEIKMGTAAKIDDHELRLKKLENKVANYFITITLYSLAVAGLITIMTTHILK